MSRHHSVRLLVLSVLVVGMAVGFSPYYSSARSYQDSVAGYVGAAQSASRFSASTSEKAYVLEARGEGSECRRATAEEAEIISRRGSDVGMHVITPIRKGLRPESTGGLLITLQGTSQLDQFPQAKAALLRAAANWEAVIAMPISIVIDVDFGPNAFGSAFPAGMIGTTSPQVVANPGGYASVRNALIANASTSSDQNLYDLLPFDSIPTDLGTTTAIVTPLATVRALGLLPSVADPVAEQSTLGVPPAVAFNSNSQFTFDPSGGIAPNTLDFEAMATHEFGHVLGFYSNVGGTELSPPTRLEVSVLDIFRFRPGTIDRLFGAASRIETSGGDQVFFFGAPELALSTGRTDGTGGDGFQADHWKAASMTGTLIGIMDPVIPKGERRTISNNDVRAFQAMGYSSQIAIPPGTVSLMSGGSSTGTVPAPQAGSCFEGTTQYIIQVPPGASQLKLDATGDNNMFLLARYGRPIIVMGTTAQTDYLTPTAKTSQEIIISGSSSPPITPGTYFIGVANCALSLQLNYTVTATVTANTAPDTPAVITSVTGDLQGNTLVLTGTATDPDGDIAQADVALLDGAGHAAGDTGLLAGSFGSATTSNFTLNVSNMQNFPSALTASLVLVDSKGNKSAPVTADFSKADPGGAQITSASFDSGAGLLSIKGSGFAAPIQLESNGTTPNVRIKIKGGGSKLKIAGSSADLNLLSGANRIRIVINGLRSNILVLVN
jgi:hypothetical protein